MFFSLLRLWLTAALCMQAYPVFFAGLRAETRPDCAELTDEIHALHEKIQPALSSLPIQALNRRQRDSLERILREEYASLHVGTDSGGALKPALVKSLILLYLGQAGVQNAFPTALSMLPQPPGEGSCPVPKALGSEDSFCLKAAPSSTASTRWTVCGKPVLTTTNNF